VKEQDGNEVQSQLKEAGIVILKFMHVECVPVAAHLAATQA
jgi:hypothetical protein